MKIEKKAFLYMFVFGIVHGIYLSLPFLLITWLIRTQPIIDLTTKMMFWSLVSIFINWILLLIVLIVMYNVGKELNLKVNLKSIVVSMLVGGFIGFYIVRLVSMPLFFIIGGDEITLNYAVSHFLGDLNSSLVITTSLFFEGFAAVTIAHLRKTE